MTNAACNCANTDPKSAFFWFLSNNFMLLSHEFWLREKEDTICCWPGLLGPGSLQLKLLQRLPGTASLSAWGRSRGKLFMASTCWQWFHRIQNN